MPELPGITIILDAPVEAGEGERWVQVAKQGKFKDPRYGTFKIDQRYFDKWLANFQQLDPDGIAIDRDHSPEKGEGTEATGWIKALEQRGKELWAKVEWNSLGRELIADARYRFLSPSYKEDFVDEEGTHHGTKLMGAALTNRPFLGMAAVTLSRSESGFLAEEVEEKETADSPRQMNPELLKALGLEEGADDAKVLEAVTALKAKADEPTPAPEGKTLEQLAAEHGSVVLSADKVLQLQQDASEGKAAAAQLRADRFSIAWSKALSAGKVTPAEEETYKTLYDVEPDKTLAAIESRPQVINTEASGSGGETGAEVKNFDRGGTDLPVHDENAELHGKVVSLMQAEPTLDYEQALDKVLEQA